MSPNYCTACGAQIPEGAPGCAACGAPVQANSFAPGGPAAPGGVPYAPAPSYYYPPVGQPANPPYPAYGAPAQTDTMTILNYLTPYLLGLIPLVGGIVSLVLMFVWAFGSSYGPNRKNFARANLIIWLIGIVLSVITIVVFASYFTYFFSALANEFYYYY
ncbi:MAG: hypothetical protein ACK5L3_09460 [Oscillospiraceae bacterium]